MLKLFQVEGFKNFKNIIMLNFSDVRDYQFNTDCITDGKIGKMILYGQNAVGKTNFGLALFDIVSHLTAKNVTPHLYDYYLNADNQSGRASFRYVFDFAKDELDYSYDKDEKQNLLFEKLVWNGKLLFSYDYTQKKGDLSELQALAPTLNLSLQDEESILKYTLSNTRLPDEHPLRQMAQYVNNMLWFRCLDEMRYIGYKSACKDYYDFILSEDVLAEFSDFLKEAGLQDRLIVKTDADGKNRLYFDAKKPLPFFSTASSGTRALYNVFYWYKTAKDVSLLFIDEFDAYYHFELSETIVKMLKAMSNTQVLLTSHNTNLLTNSIMRPDCYFILTREKLTSFSNATKRELREGHNLEKLYMSGEFDG